MLLHVLRHYRRDLPRITPEARRFLVGSALMGAAHAVQWTLLALYLDRRGFGKEDIGLVQACDSWGKVLVALPAAFLIARGRSRPIFVGAALATGIAYAALPWLGSLAAVCATNLVAGIGLSVHVVAIAPFLFRHSGDLERATVFGLSEAVRTAAAVGGGWSAGRFVAWLGPVLGGERAGLAWALSAGGLLAFAAAAAYARIDGEPQPPARPPRDLAALAAHRGVLLRFALPQLAVATGAGFCMPFLSLYFHERFSLTPGAWGSLFAAGQVLMTAGFLLTPMLLARLGFVRGMLATELLSIPFFLVLAFTTSLPVACVAFLLRAALMNNTHPLLKNFMMQATPADARELQTGVHATVWGIGWVLGPVAGGRALDASGNDYALLMCTTIALYLLAAILTYACLRPIDPTWRRGARPAPARLSADAP